MKASKTVLKLDSANDIKYGLALETHEADFEHEGCLHM